MRHLALVLFSILAVFACSSNDTENTAADAAATCVLRDEACSQGCCPQSGTRYDEAGDCLVGASKIIGCTPKPASTQCGYLGVVGCAITPEGTWVTFDRAGGWSPQATCSDALSTKVRAAKQCALSDAGADAP